MSDYDFHQLSPADFEKLSRDILQAEWEVNLESFKTGKDGGIDLRFARAGANTIIQCKHFVRTGLKGLLKELKEEAKKIHNLKPKRYVVITSVPLSPANKNDIIEIIGKDVLEPGDILGQDELNNRLSQFPDIETAHYKLWLTSRAVFDRVMNNAVVTQSTFKVQAVHENIRRYVPSDAYPRALNTLNTDRVVIIAGPPGIGKTTLADMLLYEHLERGFQAVVIQRNIEEGQRLIQLGQRQIFYFDDFLGATFLGERGLGNFQNEDRAIIDFIALVRASPLARLILTTRQHIFSQALARSERLRHSMIDDHRVILQMHDYSLPQKAQILYNHLYFSDLPSDYQDELLKDNFYLQIIRHIKYNPRLISWLSSYRRIKNTPVKSYRSFVNNLMRDPSEIWQHAYEQEISDASRSLLLALFSLGDRVNVGSLETAFARLHDHRARRYNFRKHPDDFRLAFREILGSFIKLENVVDVLDPSVTDLLNSIAQSSSENLFDLFLGAAGFDQISRVWAFIIQENDSRMIAALAKEADGIANSISLHMLTDRRVDTGKGMIISVGSTFEQRLATLISMADKFRHKALLPLIKPLMSRTELEWIVDEVNITDGLEVLRAIDDTQWLPIAEKDEFRTTIYSALLKQASEGCRSDELRELLSIIEPDDNALGSETRRYLTNAFEQYCDHHFSEELRECRSEEHFDGLASDLSLFATDLGVNVNYYLERVDEAKKEFEEQRGDYEDHMQDEWKERWRDDRDDERDMSDLFNSLRSDRD